VGGGGSEMLNTGDGLVLEAVRGRIVVEILFLRKKKKKTPATVFKRKKKENTGDGLHILEGVRGLIVVEILF